LHPSLETVGWILPLLVIAGTAIAFTERRARATLLMLAAIAVQATALWGLSKSIGAQTPYMALKMAYFAVYPFAVLGALAVGKFGEVLGRFWEVRGGSRGFGEVRGRSGRG